MSEETEHPRSQRAPEPPPAVRPGVSLGRFFGFPVRLSPSWFLMALLIMVSWGSQLAVSHGSIGYALAAAMAFSLLVSVLLHELGHALVARWRGVGVRGITLDLLGGYTEMESDPRKPSTELLFSLAGPLVSFLIGAVATVAALLMPPSLLRILIWQVAFSNLVVAVYNALPGLPLDGGRALRAAVWAINGDKTTGTIVAGWSGRVVAVLTIVVAFVLYATGLYSAVGLIIAALIAFTLWQGATASINQAKVMARFPLIDPVRLARPLFVVPTGTSLAEALRRAAEQGRPAAALGVADASGRLVALVKREAAAAVPEQRRPWVPVESIARDIDSVGVIAAGLRGEDVIRAVQQHPADEFLVTTGEDVVGVLHLADLVQLLDPRARRSAQ
ncbi:Zn-dependent protease [Hamadaea flava]|nr:Zn-dependent protease [Hamadaea flava]